MERCRMCRKAAVFIAILNDGARIPYCEKHLPEWQGVANRLWDEVTQLVLARPEAPKRSSSP